MTITKIASVLLLLLSGCELGCAALDSPAGRTLEAVVSRVDMSRLIECAELGPTEAAARCLGARVLTEGLRVAVEHASELAEQAERASSPHAGAADIDAEGKAQLAAELDAALYAVGVEVAAANGAE
jgi:hypothetical protein